LKEAYRPEQTRKKTQAPVPIPTSRRLRGYAFDQSLSTQLESFGMNEVTYKVRWERPQQTTTDDHGNEVVEGVLGAGPVGEYVEVVDYDPASGRFYRPVDLNDPLLLAQDGLPPSEGNPQFHQQMVYAVAMTTIANFERALGRAALWRPLRKSELRNEDGPGGHVTYDDFVEHEDGTRKEAVGTGGGRRRRLPYEKYVRRLRIYPHALRQANAFYSPNKRALLFGYFTASPESAGQGFPGGTVFTCLSHDVIAHETTHALLDGMHGKFIEPTHPDCLAFHEAFADMVALFQHFSFPDVVRGQIAKTRGNLEEQSLLGELAQEVGRALGHYGALRDAIGERDESGKWRPQKPDPSKMDTVKEPHARGAILVAAVFDAFLSIYKSRVADLLRIASSGSGILAPGAIHPDLVNRLANEAAKSAEHVLLMCIRALDYCPPVDITFGDYLRALITADWELVPDDDKGYRVAFLEAFRRRGIYPTGIRTLSVESLRWPLISEDVAESQTFRTITDKVRDFQNDLRYFEDREEIFTKTRDMRAEFHDFFQTITDSDRSNFEDLTGLIFSSAANLPAELVKAGLSLREEHGRPTFEVHSLRPATRVGPDGNVLNQLIISLIQTCRLSKGAEKSRAELRNIRYRAGCTLILDLGTLNLRYAIGKRMDDLQRWQRQEEYWTDLGATSLRATYFGHPFAGNDGEPFAFLHGSI
jgi:hypothetical protein